MRGVIANSRWGIASAFGLAACVGSVSPSQLVTHLQIVAVRGIPRDLTEWAHTPAIAGTPIAGAVTLVPLALDPSGIVTNGAFDYGVCQPGAVPVSGPPNCQPPVGRPLRTVRNMGLLHIPTDLPELLVSVGSNGSSPTAYVTVHVRTPTDEAVALKRVSLAATQDQATLDSLSVDGVALNGNRAVHITAGQHHFAVTGSCQANGLIYNIQDCAVSWYVTAGKPVTGSNSILAQILADQSVFDWIAPGEPGTTTVVAVVRSPIEAGDAAWTYGLLQE
jgi:hypothetical protein